MLEAVRALRAQLQSHGSNLLFCIGRTEQVMASIVKQLAAEVRHLPQAYRQVFRCPTKWLHLYHSQAAPDTSGVLT